MKIEELELTGQEPTVAPCDLGDVGGELTPPDEDENKKEDPNNNGNNGGSTGGNTGGNTGGGSGNNKKDPIRPEPNTGLGPF